MTTEIAPEYKDKISFIGLQGPMYYCINVVDQVLAEEGYAAIITSLVDGKHSPGSLHYVGYAGDWRIWHIPKNKHEDIKKKLAKRLGPQFDVVLEKDHFHIEFQPKKGTNL